MSAKMKEKVFDYIEEKKDDIVDFLCRYLEYKSVNPGIPGKGQELEVQKWISERFEEMGFDKVDYWAVDEEKKRPNVVGTIRGTGGGRSLILNGHSDVVPVPEAQLRRWTVDPWKPTVKDGRVFGRGASDMKGGNTAMIWAAKALIDNDVRLKGDLFVECVPGEESNEGGTIGTASTADRGYKAPFAIVVEPSNCEIQPITPGAFFFELTVYGKEAHTGERNLVIFPQRYGVPSGPQVGVDAISKMIPYLQFFQRLETQWNQRWRHEVLGGGGYPTPDTQGTGVFTINPSLIEGGTYIGSVPGYCKLTCLVWYPSWLKAEDVWSEIKRHVDAIASTDDWLKEHPPEFKAPVIQNWEPNEISRDHEGCKILSKAWKEATGREPVISGFKAVCDVTYFGKRNIPAVVFGPGDLSMGVHGPDEYIPIDQLIKAAKTYAAMAMEWCGVV